MDAIENPAHTGSAQMQHWACCTELLRPQPLPNKKDLRLLAATYVPKAGSMQHRRRRPMRTHKDGLLHVGSERMYLRYDCNRLFRLKSPTITASPSAPPCTENTARARIKHYELSIVFVSLCSCAWQFGALLFYVMVILCRVALVILKILLSLFYGGSASNRVHDQNRKV